MTRVEVYGRELPQSFIDAWEIGRSRAVAAMLRKEFDIAIAPIPERDSAVDLPALRRELTDAKLTLDPVQVRNRLATPVRASGLSAKALSFV